MLQTLTDEQIDIFEEWKDSEVELEEYPDDLTIIDNMIHEIIMESSGGLFPNCGGISSCSGC